MEERFMDFLISSSGFTRIDLRIPIDLESIWREGVKKYEGPAGYLRYLLSSYKLRRFQGSLPKWKFRKIRSFDSRKRIKVRIKDYCEAVCFATQYKVSLSSFISALLEMDTDAISKSPISVSGSTLEPQARTGIIIPFPLRKGGSIARGA
ncbi:hypothetical protein LEP1GSC050_1961 [Leptospira broomii serovar Hurstbridge str. 5399]|uniref:PF07600 family protein n=1 Tax=Leptospira broomii serovar Hurstbridge str. 5399 TaxID=1049789 RepID=T0F0R3_9LEPT|nr:hypothetical protein [Leptospira broomii]EQA44745.1 hypothetical protein LEP1GSC050_1961 [Leptospira broomii serovar Hurstbridge str. 5399]